MIHELKILQDCSLFKDLDIVESSISLNNNSDVKSKPTSKNKSDKPLEERSKKELIEAKEFLLNLMKTQHFMGKSTLIDNVFSQFFQVNSSQIAGSIQQLCQKKRVNIINSDGKLESQLICLIPKQFLLKNI